MQSAYTDGRPLKLGVNIDHSATVRQARGVSYPDPVEVALLAEKGGADFITAHLREDRRHIQDHDIERLQQQLSSHLNLEMAVTPEMVDIACRVQPRDACLVPEKREELTTEGGLDAAGQRRKVGEACRRLADAGIRVSLFIDADRRQIDAAAAIGAPVIELHTGGYANADARRAVTELERIGESVEYARKAGLRVNAGHGLTLGNVAAVAEMEGIEELNIGHSIVARSIYVGMEAAVREMRAAMQSARSG